MKNLTISNEDHQLKSIVVGVDTLSDRLTYFDIESKPDFYFHDGKFYQFDKVENNIAWYKEVKLVGFKFQEVTFFFNA